MALRQKQTVNWQAVGTDWGDYFRNVAPENWREIFLPVITGMITEQGQRWNAAFGMQFNVRNLFAEDWFDAYMLQFAQNINATTSRDISLLLQQAMQNGWTIDEMSRQLNLTFERYLTQGMTAEGRGLTEQEIQWFNERLPRYRRDVIARTETIRASSAGSVALFEAWDVGALKTWEATADDRTRSSHLIAWSDYSEGGRIGPIAMDQRFNVGGAMLRFPVDPLGPPDQTIQCRCVPLPFFPEFPSSQEEAERTQNFIEEELRQRAEER